MSDYPNGKFPDSALSTTYLYYPETKNGRKLREDVAPYAEALATAFYLKFGRPMEATDGYRDLDTQWDLWRKYQAGEGAPAAEPGTSNHGWGEALDLASNINKFSSAEHKWMKENAGKFGWEHPHWARQGGGREEAWHWEFVGGGAKYPRVVRPGKGEIGLGSEGEKVKEIQRLLKKTGKDIEVDGVYGLGTATTVLAVQGRHKLLRDGIAGPKTLALLKAVVDGTHGTPAEPLPAPKPDDLTVDGRWGSATTKRLQKVLGFRTQDGEIDGQPESLKGRFWLGSGWNYVPGRSVRGSQTIATLQLKLGVGLNDGIFGPQTFAALERRYGKQGRDAIKELQRRLNDGRI